jgi:hypothetical protein
MSGVDEHKDEVCTSSIPVFRGEKSKFPDWSRRIVAVCDRQDCAEALERGHEDCLPVSAAAAAALDATKLA